MGSIITTFHIDWQIMLAQLVNFGIVVFILWYFVFKPLSAKMLERTKIIETSLEQAKQIEKNLQNTEKEKQEIVRAARIQAEKIMNDAVALAKSEQQKSLENTKLEVKKVVESGKAQLELDKEKMMTEVKTQVADMVVLTTAKVLAKVVDKKIDKGLVEQTLKEVKN